MAAVTICRDFGVQENKVCHCFCCFPIYLLWPDAMILVFWMLSFKPAFPFSSFIFVKRVFSSFSISAIRVVSSAYLRLLIYLLAILIPACTSFNPVFLMSAFLGLCYFFFQGYQLCNFEQVLSLDYLICKIKGLDILSKVHLEANMYSEFKAVQSSISCTLARVLVSQGCCNSIPKLGGLRKTDFITVLGPIHLKSRCRGPCSLWALG